MPERIPFNKPFIAGNELTYIERAVRFGNIGGDGFFTRECSRIMQERFCIQRVMMTPSCTAALEMAAILGDLQPGDEVILPSFTFVSTANCVVMRGATPVFVDIRSDTMNIDESLIEAAITPRSKAILPVHYAGVACEMDPIMELAREHGLLVVEDAAQGVNACYHDKPLGSIGHLAAYSFHETKNYICGEGGALCINKDAYIERAEIIRDKGTNRQKFFRGEIDKYTWVEVGSSYVPSEIGCAFLYAQLEQLDRITQRRRKIYQAYRDGLNELEQQEKLRLPFVPDHCTTNYHMFYIVLPDQETRDALLAHLRSVKIHAVFHYVPLHSSPVGQRLGTGELSLPITDRISRCLLRLPLYYDLTTEEQSRVIEEVNGFFA